MNTKCVLLVLLGCLLASSPLCPAGEAGKGDAKLRVVLTVDEPTRAHLKCFLDTVKEVFGDVKVAIFVLKGPISPPPWDMAKTKGSLQDDGYEEALIKAIKAGHIIGCHGTKHIDYEKAGKEEIRKDIEGCLIEVKELYEKAGVTPAVYYFIQASQTE